MNQLVGELKKTKFAAVVKLVCLTSRKGLCVHPELHKIESSALLSDKCQDLAEKSKCPFRAEEMTHLLAENIQAGPMDIEDLGKLSHQMQICGYYAARACVETADIVVTPYQTVLSEAALEGVGLSLLGKVIVFDEAHNIMETIGATSSS